MLQRRKRPALRLTAALQQRIRKKAVEIGGELGAGIGAIGWKLLEYDGEAGQLVVHKGIGGAAQRAISMEECLDPTVEPLLVVMQEEGEVPQLPGGLRFYDVVVELVSFGRRGT